MLDRGLVEAAPLLLELGELAACRGGQEAGDQGEAGEAAADDVLEKLLAQRDEPVQPLCEVGRELAVEDLRDDPEGQEFEVGSRVDESLSQVPVRLETRHVSSHVPADHWKVVDGVAADKGDLDDGTEGLPVVAADEADALAEQLAHDVAGIVVQGLVMLVRVAEDGSNLLGRGEDTARASPSERLHAHQLPGRKLTPQTSCPTICDTSVHASCPSVRCSRYPREIYRRRLGRWARNRDRSAAGIRLIRDRWGIASKGRSFEHVNPASTSTQTTFSVSAYMNHVRDDFFRMRGGLEVAADGSDEDRCDAECQGCAARAQHHTLEEHTC